jgi:hypothetical protein
MLNYRAGLSCDGALSIAYSEQKTTSLFIGEQHMKEPGLDGRHRNKDSPKSGQIQQKRSDTLNKNLSKSVPQFSPDTTLGDMRAKTGKVSEESVRRAAAKSDKKR